MSPPCRRWSFSLRTLFVAVTLCGTVGYWIVMDANVRSAKQALDHATVAWEAEMVTTQDLCEASRRLLHAELNVPFADRPQATTAHLNRMERIKQKTDAYVEGALLDDFAARDKLKVEVDAYYAEAKRLAPETH
jgi:hypothetical protein